MYLIFAILTAPLWIPALYALIKDDVNRQNRTGKYKKRPRRRR